MHISTSPIISLDFFQKKFYKLFDYNDIIINGTFLYDTYNLNDVNNINNTKYYENIDKLYIKIKNVIYDINIEKLEIIPRIIIIKLGVQELKTLTLNLSIVLSQPVQENWDKILNSNILSKLKVA
jgi:hypothetical protein